MASPKLTFQVAFASQPGDEPFIWRTVPGSQDVSYNRGEPNEYARAETGESSVRVGDPESTLDPANAGELVNLVPNPSAEAPLAGVWGMGGGGQTLVQSTMNARYGTHSFLETSTAAGSFWFFTTVDEPFLAGLPYTLSAYQWRAVGNAVTNLGLDWYDASSFLLRSDRGPAALVAAGDYTRMEYTVTAPAGAVSVVIYPLIVNSGNAGDAYYVDGVQLEQAAAASAYCDGDQPNCRWAGTPHASPSYRGGPYFPNVKRMKPMRAFMMVGNLVQDGSFESGTLDAWTNEGGPIIVDSAAFDAVHSDYRAYTAGQTGAVARLSADFIPVDPSRPYTLSGYFRQWQAEGVENPLSAIRLVCYDADHNGIGYVFPNQAAPGVTYTPSHFDPVLAWGRYGGTFNGQEGQSGTATGGLIPGTAYVKVEVYWQYTGSAFANPVGVVVDAIQLVEGTEPEPWDADLDYIVTHFPLFQHFIERLPRTRSEANVWTERTITGVDGFAWLALASLKGQTYAAGQATGARVGAVLDAASWPASRRNIDGGNSTLDPATFADNDSTKALEHLLDVVQSENGFGFIDADGDVRFIERHALIRNTALVATFADGRSIDTGAYPGAVPYVDLQPESTDVFNDYTGARDGGTVYAATDATSVDEYGPRSQELTFLVDSDLVVQDALAWRLTQTKEPAERIDAITVMPGLDVARWMKVLGLEVGDRVLVVEWPPGFAAPVEVAYIIRHLQGDVPTDVAASSFTFQLTPAADTAFIVLDDPIRGRLDENKLAY